MLIFVSYLKALLLCGKDRICKYFKNKYLSMRPFNKYILRTFIMPEPV